MKKVYGIDFKENGKVVETFVCEDEAQQAALMGMWEYNEDSPHFPEVATHASATVQEVLSPRDARIVRGVAAQLVAGRGGHKPFTGHFTHSR